MNSLDKIFFTLLSYCAFVFLSLFITRNIIVSLFIGVLLIVLFYAVLLLIKSKLQKTKKISLAKLEDYLSLEGTLFQVDLIFRTIAPCFSPEKISPHGILFSQNKEKFFLYCNYKFTPSSKEDIASLYRSYDKSVSKIYILGKKPTREVIGFAYSLPIEIFFVPTGKLRTYLAKHNALPDIPSHRTNKKKTKVVFDEVFTSAKIKYYLLSFGYFLLFAILGIMRIWYSVFAFITLTLALISIIKSMKENK